VDTNIKIFGIGLSRTGTVSLTDALTRLGIAAKHFPEDKLTQDELRRGYYRLSVLDKVQALTDIPVAPFYAQFDQIYPTSKFILTTRRTEPWLISMEDHFRFWVEHNRDPFTDFILACTYGVIHFSPDRMRYVKELHEANVQSYFAGRPGKLLVLDASAGDGWEKLCGFLNCPVPDEPYPHANRKLARAATTPKGFGRITRLVKKAMLKMK
jgi:hypothetical protein